jgi:hypothetical protein
MERYWYFGSLQQMERGNTKSFCVLEKATGCAKKDYFRSFKVEPITMNGTGLDCFHVVRETTDKYLTVKPFSAALPAFSLSR